MSGDVPTIRLGDQKTKHDGEDFVDYQPVVIHADDRDMAVEIAQTFTEAWKNKEDNDE